MSDRLTKFIETTKLFGIKLKLRLQEGYFVGFICEPPAEARDEDSNDPFVALDQVVLKTASSQDCHFPSKLTFNYSEVEEFEILGNVSPSISPLISAQSSLDKSYYNGDNNPQISDSSIKLNEENNCRARVNDSRDGDSYATNLKEQGHSSSSLPTASDADVNNVSSNQNLEAGKESGFDPRLKSLFYYAKKFEYDQLNKGNATCVLPQTYFLLETRTFFEIALDIIKQESQIGCAFEGVELGPNGTLCSIQISTKEYVFIFDAASLFKNEDILNDLKSILEDDEIEKVTFDCRKASQLLRCQFDVYLTNVYDLQVADVMIQRQNLKGVLPKYLRNLLLLLVNYLNLSKEHSGYYNDRTITVTNDRIWSKRPMAKPMIELAAFNVRYLLELKRKTTILMMAEFKFAVDMFINIDDEQEDNSLVPNEFSRFDYSLNCLKKQENYQVQENCSRKLLFNSQDANIDDCNSTSPLDGQNNKDHSDDSSSSTSVTKCLNEGIRKMNLFEMPNKENSQRSYEPQNQTNFRGNENNFRGNRNNFRGNRNNFRGQNNRRTDKFEERSADTRSIETQIYPTGMTKFN